MNKIPVIIDCDPGYDDALALVLAFGSDRLDVKAVTCVAGNVGLKYTYNNALRICKFLKQDIPVCKGASKPLIRDYNSATEVHSKTGLAGVTLPEADEMNHSESAVEIMKKILEESEGKLKIIAIGPLTNVATLIRAFPNLKTKIEEIVIMGGAAVGGNVTYTAEFNIYVDAEAAKIVFESGIPMVMAGLDVTNDFQIYESEFEYYKKQGRMGKFVYESLTEYYKFYKTLGPDYKGPALHDMLPVAYLINKELFKGHDYHVEIECSGQLTYGQTVVDFQGKNPDKNVKVLSTCDKEGVIQLFQESIINLNKVVDHE